MIRYRTSFDTDEQAIMEALFLGLMAPGESEAEAAANLAEELSPVDDATVGKCKAAALEWFELEWESSRESPQPPGVHGQRRRRGRRVCHELCCSYA